jgi:thioesterase domain-containing protein/aryl carrier-like protein
VPIHIAERSPANIVEQLKQGRVSVLNATPTLVRLLAMLDAFKQVSSLRLIRLGGEPIFSRDLKTLWETLGQGIQIQLAYGSTETGLICTSTLSVEAQDTLRGTKPLPLGRAAPDVELKILDAQGAECDAGTPGEIAVTSPTVCSGYLNDDKATSKKFVNLPSGSHKERFFLTGDLGLLDTSGQLHHYGRADRQLKSRGVRIEPGEIEAALRDLPDVQEAAVVSPPPWLKQHDFIAFVQVAKAASFDAAGARDALRGQLPSAMVPPRLIAVEAFPLTATRKIDCVALARLAPKELLAPQELLAPPPAHGGVRQKLHSIWVEVLEHEHFSPQQSFFQAGADSMHCMQLVSVLEREGFGAVAPLRLFACESLEAMAAYLQNQAEGQPRDWVPLREPGPSPEAPIVIFLGTYPYIQTLKAEVPEGWGAAAIEPATPFEQTFDDTTAAADLTIEAWTDGFEAALKQMAPQRPIVLVGYSFEGLLAFELAHRARKRGLRLRGVVFLDSILCAHRASPVQEMLLLLRQKQLARIQTRLNKELRRVMASGLRRLRPPQLDPDRTDLSRAIARLQRIGKADSWQVAETESKLIRKQAQTCYKPQVLDVPAVLFKVKGDAIYHLKPENETWGWAPYFLQPIHVVEVPGDHLDMIQADSLEQWKGLFARELSHAFPPN